MLGPNFITILKGNAMKTSKLTIIIICLASLTLFNVLMLFGLDYLETRPRTSYQIELLGATFKAAEDNTIDLIRPPRVSVVPPANVNNTTKYTNTTDIPLYFRASYAINIQDEEKTIDTLNDAIQIQLNDNWELKNGCWYYQEAVLPGQSIYPLIQNITYSEEFTEHLDCKVYIPILIECSEDGKTWTNKDISTLDYQYNQPTTWTTQIKLQ